MRTANNFIADRAVNYFIIGASFFAGSFHNILTDSFRRSMRCQLRNNRFFLRDYCLSVVTKICVTGGAVPIVNITFCSAGCNRSIRFH